VFDDEMLTIEDLAAYLKLKPQTIYKWAQTGKIPGAKFGKEWRFRRSTIEKWIDSKISGPPAPSETAADSGGAQGTRHSLSGQAPRSRDGGAAREGEIAQRDGLSSAVSTAPGGRTAGPNARERFGGGVAPELGLAAKVSPENSVLLPEGSAILPEGSVMEEVAAHAAERSYLQGGPALPVEKLTGARKGPRSGRKDRGPESN
jgi:excisionase family DNA binding protein